MPALHVEGLRELSLAFRVADAKLNKDLRGTLKEVAEPVRADAEALAISAIPRMTLPWSRMRTGVTAHSVYVAPRNRGVKSRTDRRRRRPNLFELMMGRALEPALERNERHVIAGMESLLDEVGKAWEQVPGG